MKVILRLAVILLAIILVAVLGTLSFVKARQASELRELLERSGTQNKELRSQIKTLKGEIDTLEEKLRELAAQNALLASQQKSAEAPKTGGLAQACPAPGPNRTLDQAQFARQPLEMRYKPGVLRVSNDGQSVILTAAAGSSLKIGPEIFDLVRIHFYRPEGGQVDGKPVALVAHLVHRIASGETVVVSVPIRESAFQHRTIWQIWNNLPNKGAAEVTVSNVSIDPTQLLPENLSYQAYEGTLPVPPCTEKVRFYQLRTPIGISKDQLERFLMRVKAPSFKDSAIPQPAAGKAA
jgi:carbonic anhydrase/cell division protein FtsB